MKDNNNEGRKKRNWKRVAREVECFGGLKNDAPDETFDESVVLAEYVQDIKKKQKGDNVSLTNLQTKKNKIEVEREAIPKWLPSPQ